MSDQPKRFPIIREGISIPWAVAEPLRALAHEVHGQSLERLAERGGLDRAELGGLLTGYNVFGGSRDLLHGCESSLPIADRYLPVSSEPVVPLSEVKEALLGEEAVEAAEEEIRRFEGLSNEEVDQYDDGESFGRMGLKAAFDAAFSSDSEEGKQQ